ncbi:hypothetical protein [uncultured Clostridium sp.]|uniref:hypothetical protein n=1 Tax=uncultured Clostridium sp. TaxID=59620 RepID=UPI0025F79531|nr:hypothetical protein [uncultured Clostridium sp.]MDU4883075.1 hypothetical protein [Clostridium celatum]MDU7076205.1 hypothetical protein [Clostridium celatum]
MSRKIYILMIMIIVSSFLIIIGGNLYNYINQNRLTYEADKRYEEYLNNVMRFPVEIKGGEYRGIDYGDIFLLNEDDGDKKFEDVSKKIFIDEINTNYSEYVITNDTSYIAINIGSEIKFIEHSVPISSIYLKNLKDFMREINDNSINVFPFNDGIYCFISTNEQQYIFNIESGKIIWTRGAYYESPTVDIFNDTLKCGGDLSTNTYIFNKYGELVKTIKPQLNYIGLIVDISKFNIIILILIIIQRMCKFNIKSTLIRNIVNVFIVFTIILVLLLFTIVVALRISG